MADIVNNPDTTQNFDAEVFKEAIAEGETKGIEVDLAADYDAAQEMSKGTLSQSEAEASVAPDLKVPQPSETAIAAKSANDSVDYADMAKQVNPTPASTDNVTDELMEKALQKGQAGN